MKVTQSINQSNGRELQTVNSDECNRRTAIRNALR
jgi:hypothetical protein